MRLFKSHVVSERAVARLGQGIACAGACLIPVLAFRRFAEIEVSEAQLLIGVATTMSLAVSCAMLALLLESKTRAA